MTYIKPLEWKIFDPVLLADYFLSSIDIAAGAALRRFCRERADVGKWMIAADFSLHDPNRPADCFAFTLLPYDLLPADLEKEVRDALPKDLKKTKELDEVGAAWLRSERAFHVAIIVDRDRPLWNDGTGREPLLVARDYIDACITAAASHGPSDTVTRLKKLRQSAAANKFNLDLLGDLTLLSFFMAALTVLLTRDARATMVGWFPDRDNMTTWNDGVWHDYATSNFRAFCSSSNVDYRKTDLVAAAPDTTAGKMWYDYMIRAADWFAGALASWHLERNLIPGEHLKYRQMLEEVVADSNNLVILRMVFADDRVKFRQVVAKRHPPQATER